MTLPRNSRNIDVLGLGCATVDDILYVDRFPQPDEKTTVTAQVRQCGGLTATALVAAARYGAVCAYGGVLGTDALSEFVRGALAADGIDLTHSPVRDDARPIHCTIIVDTTCHTRNVFRVLGEHVGPGLELPSVEVIRSSGVVFVDHYGGEGTVRAARIAREAGIPVVGDMERDTAPCFSSIIDLVDHLVLSEKFALCLTGASSPEAAAGELLTGSREAVVITCGERGSCAAERDSPVPERYPAFPVRPVDTTGCGDVFHGVYAAALAEGMPLGPRVRAASAAAGLKATGQGAQEAIARRIDIDRFLSQA